MDVLEGRAEGTKEGQGRERGIALKCSCQSGVAILLSIQGGRRGTLGAYPVNFLSMYGTVICCPSRSFDPVAVRIIGSLYRINGTLYRTWPIAWSRLSHPALLPIVSIHVV
jgi:hypothetical protein